MRPIALKDVEYIMVAVQKLKHLVLPDNIGMARLVSLNRQHNARPASGGIRPRNLVNLLRLQLSVHVVTLPSIGSPQPANVCPGLTVLIQLIPNIILKNAK